MEGRIDVVQLPWLQLLYLIVFVSGTEPLEKKRDVFWRG